MHKMGVKLRSKIDNKSKTGTGFQREFLKIRDGVRVDLGRD